MYGYQGLGNLSAYGIGSAYTWSYILVLVCFFAALIASSRVKSVYAKFDEYKASKGLTAEQAAQRVLDYYGITNVSIQHIPGELSDNFNPKTNIISLSDSTYGHSSIAAIGVACHEAGSRSATSDRPPASRWPSSAFSSTCPASSISAFYCTPSSRCSSS